jgi:tungstate transport system substrate-binding protein
LNRGKKITAILAIFIVAIIAISIVAFSGVGEEKQILRIATTTSLEDTGLLTELEREFEAKYPNIDVQIVSAGTGQALEYGKKGDVDLVMVHSKKQEMDFIDEGYGSNRTIFAYNYFFILGPENDPANIKGSSAGEAFNKIKDSGESSSDNVKFISRGDNSGTNNREITIWNSTGENYNASIRNHPWYIETGKGMGDTITIANEKSAYTLSDSGTYLAFKGNITLTALVTDGKDLLNVYSLIPVNPSKFPNVNSDAANKWIAFVTSKEGQDIIGKYGVSEYKQTLFTPFVGTEDPKI